MKKLLNLLLLITACGYADAQVPGLTKFDLYAGGSNSYPLYLTPFSAANGGKICFFANDGSSKGWELYTCDGVAKPVLVLDVNPAGASTVQSYSNRPTAVINNKLYYTGNNGNSGPELFIFNGATMPLLLQDIIPGTEGSDPDDYAVLNNQLYFRARNAAYGYELWTYDPVAVLSNRLTDINPGSDSSVNGNIIAFNNKIYFTADSGMGNNELYQFEPFSSTTMMLADINPGVAGSYPQSLTVINNKLYFSAVNAANGRELWMFDGTNPPTRVTQVVSGFLDGLPSRTEPMMAPMGNYIYLSAKDSTSNDYLLFQYDATNGNIVIAPKSTATKDPLWLTPYGGKLYYTAYNDTTGYELWAYDATSGATLITDLCPGSNGSNPADLVVTGNDLYFKAEECGGVGMEVFKFNYQEVGITNVKFDGEIKVFPNPARNVTNISIKQSKAEKLSIDVCDITGKPMYTGDVSNATDQLTIDTHTWPSGVYYYTVRNSEHAKYSAGKVTVE